MHKRVSATPLTRLLAVLMALALPCLAACRQVPLRGNPSTSAIGRVEEADGGFEPGPYCVSFLEDQLHLLKVRGREA